MTTQELTTTASSGFMPVMAIQDAIARRNAIVEFVKTVMVRDTDYGVIPGTDKPTLFKAGSEKLNTLFGLSSHFTITEKETDWTGAGHNGEPFFYFVYRCKLYRGDLLIAESDGSCNSMEKKYRYRWYPAHEATRLGINLATTPTTGGRVSEFDFAVEKSETTGKYGKPASYWQAFKDAIANNTARKIKKSIRDGSERDAWEIDQTLYRAPNPDVADVVNTIQKMAQKRALVAATLLAVNASEFFTQDVEDMDIIEGSYSVKPDAPKVEQKATAQSTTQQPTSTNGKSNTLDALIDQAQKLLDNPPKQFGEKEFATVKNNWQKLFETARAEGASTLDAVKADAKPSEFLKAIVEQGKRLKELRASVAQADKPADPDISEWTGGAK